MSGTKRYLVTHPKGVGTHAEGDVCELRPEQAIAFADRITPAKGRKSKPGNASGPKPGSAPPEAPDETPDEDEAAVKSFTSMNKTELLAAAAEAGIEVPEGTTNKAIQALLEA